MDVNNELNFQPNLAARLLARGQSAVIDMVNPAGLSAIFSDSYFPNIIHSVSSACNKLGCNVMLWLAEPEHERRMIQTILHGGLLDGVLVSSMLVDDPLVKSLYDSSMPSVLVGRHPTLDINFIDNDNVPGGYQATMHMIEQGFRSITTDTGPQNMITGIDRYEGCQKALLEQGREIYPGIIFEGDFTEESGYNCMRALLRHEPDAVFQANDTMAMGALRALWDADLRMPEDVALVGFDGTPGADKSDLPLTMIRKPIQTMGAAAVRTLLAIIYFPESETRTIFFQTELVIRRSSGEGRNKKFNL